MIEGLTKFEKVLCNELQNGLELVERPFAKIADKLGVSEDAAIEGAAKLKAMGVIRRIAATVDYKALGRTGVLVCGHVEAERIEAVAAMVSELEGVSHNYKRNHFYNLWFTLQARGQEQVESILASLGKQAGVEFHALAAVKVFKLNVRFDALSGGKSLLNGEQGRDEFFGETVVLNEVEKKVLGKVQGGIEITREPFGHVELEVIKSLSKRGVIRKIAAVAEYRKLGFAANAMAVFAVGEGEIEEVGRELAKSSSVSHCYWRRGFEGWPYTLFGMMHGANEGELKEKARSFASEHRIGAFEVLTTVREFKKKPVAIT